MTLPGCGSGQGQLQPLRSRGTGGLGPAGPRPGVSAYWNFLAGLNAQVCFLVLQVHVLYRFWKTILYIALEGFAWSCWKIMSAECNTKILK